MFMVMDKHSRVFCICAVVFCYSRIRWLVDCKIYRSDAKPALSVLCSGLRSVIFLRLCTRFCKTHTTSSDSPSMVHLRLLQPSMAGARWWKRQSLRKSTLLRQTHLARKDWFRIDIRLASDRYQNNTLSVTMLIIPSHLLAQWSFQVIPVLPKCRMLWGFINCILEQSFSVYQNYLMQQQFACRNYAIVLTCNSCRCDMSVGWNVDEMRLSAQRRFSWALLIKTTRSDHGWSEQAKMNHGWWIWAGRVNILMSCAKP